MGALATCTVVRPNRQHLNEPIIADGFAEHEESYNAHILFFDNSKAYVVRTDNSKIYWVNISQLTNVVALT